MSPLAYLWARPTSFLFPSPTTARTTAPNTFSILTITSLHITIQILVPNNTKMITLSILRDIYKTIPEFTTTKTSLSSKFPASSSIVISRKLLHSVILFPTINSQIILLVLSILISTSMTMSMTGSGKMRSMYRSMSTIVSLRTTTMLTLNELLFSTTMKTGFFRLKVSITSLQMTLFFTTSLRRKYSTIHRTSCKHTFLG